ncbi:MAG: hypothetical protein ABIB11_01495, partial [Candidatus Omnitrophota bacterium]
ILVAIFAVDSKEPVAGLIDRYAASIGMSESERNALYDMFSTDSRGISITPITKDQDADRLIQLLTLVQESA